MKLLILAFLAIALHADEAKPEPFIQLSQPSAERLNAMLARWNAINLEQQALAQEMQAIRWKTCVEQSIPVSECGDWDQQGHLVRKKPEGKP